MVKLRKDLDRLSVKGENEYETNKRKNGFSKVEATYVALICFSLYCLSCINLETGRRSPVGNTVTKSAAFNALFRRTYNLRIMIHVKDVVTGLICTVMMILADKYGIPYLYLPWLVNTMRGMALHEGPTLVNLANTLLSNITLPAGTFILITFFLYAEELLIWNEVFTKFQHCWKYYHYRQQSDMRKMEEKLFIARNKKMLCKGNKNQKPNTAIEMLNTKQKPMELYNQTNSPNSLDSRLRYIKSTIGDSGAMVRNQLLDVTG